VSYIATLFLLYNSAVLRHKLILCVKLRKCKNCGQPFTAAPSTSYSTR